MNTCKTCRWWATRPDPNDERFRECNHPIIDNEIRGNGFYVDQDIGGYTLMFGPDFGCIHHEPSEPQVGKLDKRQGGFQ